MGLQTAHRTSFPVQSSPSGSWTQSRQPTHTLGLFGKILMHLDGMCLDAMEKDVSRNGPQPTPRPFPLKVLNKVHLTHLQLQTQRLFCEAQGWTCQPIAMREGNSFPIFWFSSEDKWESVLIWGLVKEIKTFSMSCHTYQIWFSKKCQVAFRH